MITQGNNTNFKAPQDGCLEGLCPETPFYPGESFGLARFFNLILYIDLIIDSV
jgi:hypothetical protein